MKRFVVGFLVTVAVMVAMGWLFQQSVIGGWGPSPAAPAWLQSVGLLAWLLFKQRYQLRLSAGGRRGATGMARQLEKRALLWHQAVRWLAHSWPRLRNLSEGDHR